MVEDPAQGKWKPQRETCQLVKTYFSYNEEIVYLNRAWVKG